MPDEIDFFREPRAKRVQNSLNIIDAVGKHLMRGSSKKRPPLASRRSVDSLHARNQVMATVAEENDGSLAVGERRKVVMMGERARTQTMEEDDGALRFAAAVPQPIEKTFLRRYKLDVKTALRQTLSQWPGRI